jgi:hypothetical protein
MTLRMPRQDSVVDMTSKDIRLVEVWREHSGVLHRHRDCSSRGGWRNKAVQRTLEQLATLPRADDWQEVAGSQYDPTADEQICRCLRWWIAHDETPVTREGSRWTWTYHQAPEPRSSYAGSWCHDDDRELRGFIGISVTSGGRFEPVVPYWDGTGSYPCAGTPSDFPREGTLEDAIALCEQYLAKDPSNW